MSIERIDYMQGKIDDLQRELSVQKIKLAKASDYIQEAKAVIPGIVSGEPLSQACRELVRRNAELEDQLRELLKAV